MAVVMPIFWHFIPKFDGYSYVTYENTPVHILRAPFFNTARVFSALYRAWTNPIYRFSRLRYIHFSSKFSAYLRWLFYTRTL
jgi:hypothetical protein